MRKTDFCLCESNYTADQRVCFRYSDSTVPFIVLLLLLLLFYVIPYNDNQCVEN